MSEMVERVARAIGEALFGYYESLEEGDSSSSAQARLAARVAIAAMREPTEEMLSAGDSMMPQIAPGEDITTGRDALAEAWPAMLDAALSPTVKVTTMPHRGVVNDGEGRQ